MRRSVAAEMPVTDRLLNRISSRHRHDAAEAEARRQQVSHRDRTPGGNRVVELCVDATEHLTIRKFRKPAFYRIVEPECAFVDQNHGRSRGDRFRDRGNAEDRVTTHWLRSANG